MSTSAHHLATCNLCGLTWFPHTARNAGCPECRVAKLEQENAELRKKPTAGRKHFWSRLIKELSRAKEPQDNCPGCHANLAVHYDGCRDRIYESCSKCSYARTLL